MTCLKKLNRVKVHSFLQRAATLNGYVARLLSSYYLQDATEATKKIVPHDDAEFAMNMLHAMPKTWKQQYHLGHKAPPIVEYLQDALEKSKWHSRLIALECKGATVIRKKDRNDRPCSQEKITELGEVHSWEPKVRQAHQVVCIFQKIWGRSQHSQHE